MMVIGKTFGTTTLVYWSQEEVATTVEVVVGINLDLVREDLRKIAPDQTFEVTAAGDTLILTGTVGDNVVQTRLVEGARAYVKNVVNLLRVQKLEQVLLQIRVSEIDRTLAKELGFNFLFRGEHPRRRHIPGNNFNPLVGDPVSPILGPNALSDTVERLRHQAGGCKISPCSCEPLTTREGSRFWRSRTSWSPTARRGSSWWEGSSPSSLPRGAGERPPIPSTYKEYGVRLDFQPKISPNGEIYLNVSQEVSELDLRQRRHPSGVPDPGVENPQGGVGTPAGGRPDLRPGRAHRQQGVEAGLQDPPPRRHPDPGGPVPEHEVPEQRDRADGDGHAEDRPSAEQGRDPGAPLGDDEARGVEPGPDLVGQHGEQGNEGIPTMKRSDRGQVLVLVALAIICPSGLGGPRDRRGVHV